jgi:hypothetical protein
MCCSWLAALLKNVAARPTSEVLVKIKSNHLTSSYVAAKVEANQVGVTDSVAWRAVL